MEKSAREGRLGSLAEGAYQMAPSSSSLVGGTLSAYSAYFMLLRAAIDGDLRLLKEMVVCLDKGQGEAATVEAVSYKGIGVMHIAAHMGRKPVLDYLELELGMDSTLINDVAGETTGKLSKGAYIDGIICEVTSKFPQAQDSHHPTRGDGYIETSWVIWALNIDGPALIYLTPPFKLKVEVEELKH